MFNFLNPKMFFGVVESINDPEKLGRLQVRVYGIHSSNKELIPTDNLPWAYCINSNNASLSGIGHSTTEYIQGSLVCGFFTDQDCQTPLIIGSINTLPLKKPDPEQGFNDPDSTFPKFIEESDINRLARNEKIEETIVKTKKDNVVKDIEGSNETKWSEPETPYNAEYPHNNVYESVAGHIKEVDNTPEHERLHEYHKAGTFKEVHPDGTTVTKVVKDNYNIICGDDYVLVEGKVNIVVKGDANLKVEGDTQAEIKGETYIKSDGKTTVECPEIELGIDSSEPMVMGDKLATWIKSELKPWLDTHQHLGNLGSPTSSSIIPFQVGTAEKGGAVYSKKNKTQK